MHVKEQDNFLLGVQQALTLPIRRRCAELTVLLDRATLLELHNFFPVLIDNIFGPQGTLCWGLRTTTAETNSEDFRQLQHFLSPCGPLFKLIYRLLKDSNIKYDFPLAYLPVKIKQFLENSQGHPFYSELVYIDVQTKEVVSMLLNPFDYYMFHFAYHLINPWQQRTGSYASSWNTVYYVLCCDYILHFLPTDPTATVLPVIYYNGKNPLQTMKSSFLEHPKISGLINSKTLKSPDETFKKNLDVHHPRNEIWRSETVLTVFTDMWLHSNQVSDTIENNSFNSSPIRLLYHTELPTAEYMRIVRVMIKQLHGFSASAKADDTSMAELKKVSVPMIQGKFYAFLRNLIHRWPLDGSFRLVLELWLTYIQPWRYPPNNLIKHLDKRDLNTDADDVATQHYPDKEHLPFIAENLLAYIVIFQQLLPRFVRVDLVSPKMALMLYRLTKVFDQPNLPSFLKEIEQCVENNTSPSHSKYNQLWRSNLPPLSPTTNWSTNTALGFSNVSTVLQNANEEFVHHSNVGSSLLHSEKKWSAIVRQKIFELEGPNFCYKPLFSDPPAKEVFQLVLQIRRSIRQAEELVRLKEEEEKKLYGGYWGSIKYFFSNPVSNDEFTLKERQKVPMYLQVSLQNLTDMFNIPEVTDFEVEQGQLCASQTRSAFDVSQDFKFLTPERVRQRLKTLRYDGDPDLHPIRSTENAFLVRVLYQISLKINEIYGSTFNRLYHDPSFLGRLSRQFLCPPITVYRYNKTMYGSQRVSSDLPPRVSLRFMASYKFLTYLFIGVLLAYLLGYRLEMCLLCYLVVVFVYKCFKALRRPAQNTRLNYPTEGFGNISFNDSF